MNMNRLLPALLRRRTFAAALILSLAWWLLPLHLRAAESFRFAWLSDTHVGTETAADDLRAAVRDINTMPDVQFVVISGDITEYGSRVQLTLTKDILADLKVPCHIIPGNHDTKWSESGATDFPRVFGSDRFVFDHGGYRFIGMHQGPLMKMGDGHFAPQDIRWLDTTLARLRNKSQPIIFITHYPLDDGIANWFEVVDRLKKVNTQVVLVGHGHSNRKMSYEGVPGVMGRSNVRAGRPAGGFTLVDVADGQMTFAEHTHGQSVASPWHTVTLGKRDYASDTNRYPRPDYSVNQAYASVRPRWQHVTHFTIASTPAVWRNLAIVGDASGTVYAFALETGKVRWKFKTQDAVYTTPDVADDTVVFASADGCVYALNASNGRQRWKFKTDRPIVACPRIADGVVYIGSSEGKFRALNLKNGKLLWEFGQVQGFVETRPLVHNGKVVFGAWSCCLYALETRTGRLAWTWKGDKPGALLSPAAVWPIAAEGKVFVVAPDRKMTAIDERTGEPIWRTGDYVVRESIGLSEDGQRFYVRAMNDFFYAFATAPTQPEKLWETNAKFGYDINSAMLVEKDGVLFYGTKNGLLFALDARTGDIRWQHKLGTGVMNTVVPLSANRVLATDFDGRVALIEARP
jgi:outer membrane protein assembly factor BamB/predicted phosphodiesterase